MHVNQELLNGPFFGNLYVKEVTAVVFAFAMGAIPVGTIVAWLVADMDRADVRTGLDGPFALLRLFARAAAVARIVLEIVVAVAPVALAAHGGGPAFGVAAAVAVLAGRLWSPWRRRARA